MGMGADTQQIQKGMAVYGSGFNPQNSKDFFTQAAISTNPQDKALLNKTGQEVFAQEQQLTPYQTETLKIQREGNRVDWAKLLSDRAAAIGGGTGANKLKPVPIDTVNKIQKAEDSLGRIQGILQQAAGIDSPLGTMPSSKFFNWVRGLADEDFANFNAQVGQQFQEYRIAVTGAGASKGEIELLEENMPTATDTKEVFLKKAKTNLIIGERIRNRKIKGLRQYGYDVENVDSSPVTSLGQEVLGPLEMQEQDLQRLMRSNPNSPLIPKLQQLILKTKKEYLLP